MKWYAVLLLAVLCAASFLIRHTIETGGGLQGRYTAEHQWGTDTRSRTDRTIDTSAIERGWNYALPPKFRVQWTGFLAADQPGWYSVSTRSDDGSAVTIDGFAIVDNSGDHPPRDRGGRVRLTRGSHSIVVDYEETGGGAEMLLRWGSEGSEGSPIPRWALWTTPPSPGRLRAARFFSLVPSSLMGVLIGVVAWCLWPQMSRAAVAWRPDWVLVLILVFAAYFRLQFIDMPMADAHGWRQIFNADVARHFAEGSLNIFYPEVNWGGSGDPRVSMEFPLLPWLAAVIFRLVGERDIVARLIALVFSLVTIIGLYGLGTLMWNRAVGRGAAFMLAISPSAIFFGRAFIADTPMLCFSVLGVWGFASYLHRARRASLIWGTAATALACMVKLPAVVILAPIAWLAWERDGFRLIRDRGFVAGVATALLLTVAWYGHADRVFHQTALGVAIFHPVGGYPAEMMEGAGPLTLVSSWNTRAQLTDPEYYRTLADRFWYLHLTPLGVVLVAVGVFVCWSMPKRRFVDVWFLSVASFILLAAEGNRWHEFYQLPILLPAAIYFGFAARPFFDTERLRRMAPMGLAVALSLGVLAAIGLSGFEYSRVVQDLYRPYNQRLRPIRVGDVLYDVTPPGALIVTTEYERFGGNSPVLLHYARRRGWSFDTTSLTPELIKRLHDKFGAQYFVTLIWSDLEKQRPEVAAYLKTQQGIPVPASDVALFALQ